MAQVLDSFVMECKVRSRRLCVSAANNHLESHRRRKKKFTKSKLV
jgi:hypothetical protein